MTTNLPDYYDWRDVVTELRDMDDSRAERAADVVIHMGRLVSEMRAQLLKWAVSRHSCKCYLCDTEWSEGAPDIHRRGCLLARPGHDIADGMLMGSGGEKEHS